MGWLIRLAAMIRCGSRLGDLENRVDKLERHLEVPDSGVVDKPVKPLESVKPLKPARRMVGAEKRKVLARELLDSGISQSETARRVGVSRQYISQLVTKGL